MRSLAITVTCVAIAVGGLISCDRRTPTRPTPQQTPAPTPVAANATGDWVGVMGVPSYYDYGEAVRATVMQSTELLEGTLFCGGFCLFSGMPFTGTIVGHAIRFHGTYAFGTCTFGATLSADSSRIDGTYQCTESGGVWQMFRAAPSQTELPTCTPQLLAPARGVALDNGRTDFLNPIEWTFDWTDCVGSDEHTLAVLGPSTHASFYRSRESSFSRVECGFIADVNRFNWQVWVRSRIGGYWGPWSPSYAFEVERVDSDPISPTCPPR